MDLFLKKIFSFYTLGVLACFNGVHAEEKLSLEELKSEAPEAFETLGAKRVSAVATMIEEAFDRSIDSTSFANGRLTLASATPITTSNVSAATTVYFTPFNGNRISLYSGTTWQLISFSQVSVAVPSTTTTNFDIFGYNNAGTLTLETVNWTDDTTRATALTTQDGVYVKTGATTRRYLGTGRTTGTSGQTEDSYTKRYLWNMVNQAPRTLLVTDSTSHSYDTNSFRQYRATSTNQIDVVVGQTGVQIYLSVPFYGSTNSTAGAMRAGVGVDSTTVNSANFGGDITVGGITHSHVCFYTGYVSLGRHYYALLQYADTATTTWATAHLNGWIYG